MNFFNDLEAVYCINLDKDVERKKFMIEQFEKYGLTSKVKFIEACSPVSEQFIQAKNEGKIEYSKNDIAPAIAISHYNAWQEIINNNQERALVLEDDIEFNHKYLDNASKKMNLARFDLNEYIVHLMTNYPKRIVENNKNKDQLIVQKIKYGMGAYIIGKCFALRLSSEIFPIKRPVDDYMWTMKRYIRKRLQFLHIPIICQNISNPKTIAFESDNRFKSSFNRPEPKVVEKKIPKPVRIVEDLDIVKDDKTPYKKENAVKMVASGCNLGHKLLILYCTESGHNIIVNPRGNISISNIEKGSGYSACLNPLQKIYLSDKLNTKIENAGSDVLFKNIMKLVNEEITEKKFKALVNAERIVVPCNLCGKEYHSCIIYNKDK